MEKHENKDDTIVFITFIIGRGEMDDLLAAANKLSQYGFSAEIKEEGKEREPVVCSKNFILYSGEDPVGDAVEDVIVALSNCTQHGLSGMGFVHCGDEDVNYFGEDGVVFQVEPDETSVQMRRDLDQMKIGEKLARRK